MSEALAEFADLAHALSNTRSCLHFAVPSRRRPCSGSAGQPGCRTGPLAHRRFAACVAGGVELEPGRRRGAYRAAGTGHRKAPRRSQAPPHCRRRVAQRGLQGTGATVAAGRTAAGAGVSGVSDIDCVLLDFYDRPGCFLSTAGGRRARRPHYRAPHSYRRSAWQQPRKALELCNALLAELPDEQQLIAWRATALRVLGDPEYSQLHDYARLVRGYRLQSGRAGGIAEFNEVFARECTALHRSQRRPLAQSLRGGSQTARNLPADNPVFAEFFAMLHAPIRDYIGGSRNWMPRIPRNGARARWRIPRLG